MLLCSILRCTLALQQFTRSYHNNSMGGFEENLVWIYSYPDNISDEMDESSSWSSISYRPRGPPKVVSETTEGKLPLVKDRSNTPVSGLQPAKCMLGHHILLMQGLPLSSHLGGRRNPFLSKVIDYVFRLAIQMKPIQRSNIHRPLTT